jgi:hypothetical protein
MNLLTQLKQSSLVARGLTEIQDGVRHCLLAAQGALRVVVDLAPAPEVGTLGLAMLQHTAGPSVLGIPFPIPSNPDGEPAGPHDGVSLGFGPSYKEADASWVPLAGVPRTWCDITWRTLADAPDRVEFDVLYRIGGGPRLWEQYTLTEAGLTYKTWLEWVVGGFRLQVPSFVTNGQLVGVRTIERNTLRLRVGSYEMVVRSRDDRQGWEVDTLAYANAHAVYQNLYLQGRSTLDYEVDVSIHPCRR